jgi:putative ABC transport system permease protein
VAQQLKFSNEKDLGFDKENLLVVERAEWTKSPEAFANELKNLTGIINASWCTSVPPYIFGGDKFQGEGNEKSVPLNFAKADESYVPTLGIKLQLGRNFSKESPADSARVILNRQAVEAFGWKLDESVIGKRIQLPGQDPSEDSPKFEVIGVTDDFHFWSLLTPIEPMAIFHINNPLKGSNTDFLVMRVDAQSTEQWKATMEGLQNKWKSFAGDNPLQYSFVDRDFANAFKSTERFGTSLSVLSALAILIAALGLLGMIIYTLEQRTKEIGIRKVSGASVLNIFTLISKEYTKLIVIAFCVSTPLAYWGVHLWLNDFEYRISPSPWVFVVSGGLTLLLAFAITSYHSLQAAKRNPVDVLKSE